MNREIAVLESEGEERAGRATAGEKLFAVGPKEGAKLRVAEGEYRQELAEKERQESIERLRQQITEAQATIEPIQRRLEEIVRSQQEGDLAETGGNPALRALKEKLAGELATEKATLQAQRTELEGKISKWNGELTSLETN